MSIGNVTGGNAYAYMQKMMKSATDTDSSSATSGASGASGGGFANMVEDAAKNAINTIKSSEDVATGAMTGKASLAEVVTAVNSADIALKSVVAIRDKVINAYQDIMKMPI